MNEKYLAHLAEAVRIPTLSSANDEATDWAPFEALHAFLREAYPLMHSRMEVIEIGRASLLFHLPAKMPKRAPILLMAHQDVVPTGDPEQWTYDPFSATIADGCLWGRGSNDCKSLLIAECETVEALLSEGFAPDYDIYISFGHNEEVLCDDTVKGSVLAAKYLKEHGVQIGILFDEGGVVNCGKDSGDSCDTARVGMAEKAPCQFMLSKDGRGGHASKPGRGTVLGDVARAMAAVEANPFPYRLTPLAKVQLTALAPLQTGARKEIFADPEGKWEALCELAKNDREIDAILHTTCAVTMASGSPQANVLPAHAECQMSVRILQGDTVESVCAYLQSIMPDGVTVSVPFGEDPHPEGSTESEAFRLLSETIHEVYGEETVVLPTILTGATDSRNYSEVADNIFRFSGRYFNKQWVEAHQIDEKVPVDVVEPAVRFFKAFLQAYNA